MNKKDVINRIEALAGDEELIETRTPPVLLDVRGAAKHLGLREARIRHLVQKRRLPFFKTSSGRLRFPVANLDEWWKRLEAEVVFEISVDDALTGVRDHGRPARLQAARASLKRHREKRLAKQVG